MAETIQISLNEIPSSPDLKPTGKSVNFGPGADLLMNPNKQKKESVSSDIVLDDLAELNTISLDEPKEKKSVTTTKSNFLFSGTDFKQTESPTNNSSNSSNSSNNIKLNVEPINETKGILKGSSGITETTQDDDGFKKFNDIPIDPTLNVPDKKPMTMRTNVEIK